MSNLCYTKEQIQRLFSTFPFVTDNCLSIEHFEPDDVSLRMDIQPRHLNQYHTLHGGYLLLLADTAAGAAALTDGRTYVTQSQSFAFLRAVRGKTAHAAARVISRGKTVVVVRVSVTDENGVLVGDGSFNMYAAQSPKASAQKSPE